MKIGIIGAGNIGTGLGRHLSAQGHDIVVSFARTEENLAEAAALIGGGTRTGSPEEAALHGEVVILATPWAVALEVAGEIAQALAGKVLWDTTNPFAPDMTELLIGTSTSAGEEIARAAPGARVVKAIPPFAQLLHAPPITVQGHAPGVFVCGDDAEARSMVGGLAQGIGFAVVDAGPLKLARYTEPAGMLLTNLAYLRGMGPRTTLVVVTESGQMS